MDCLFCKIVSGQIPAKLVHQGDSVIAFDDINPQAPTHVLIIPKKHFENVGELAANDPLARLLALKRTVVMGILNVTPDSFSDGGQFNEPARAIVHARRMADEGADILDIGAESSRPYVGMTPVSEDDELARLRHRLRRGERIDALPAVLSATAFEQSGT